MSLCQCVFCVLKSLFHRRCKSAPPPPSVPLMPRRPSDFLVHVASKSAVGVARQRHVRSLFLEASITCAAHTLLQVFVNRSSADDPPALAASRASGALPQPLSTSAPSTGVLRPLHLAPFGMVVSDTQSTTASSAAVTRGRGNMTQLQAADDRYRPCSDGTPPFTLLFSPLTDRYRSELPRSLSPAAALQRRRQLQAAAAGATHALSHRPLVVHPDPLPILQTGS